MTQFDGGSEIVRDWIKPFGTIFINSLKLIAVPLILASLIKGVSESLGLAISVVNLDPHADTRALENDLSAALNMRVAIDHGMFNERSFLGGIEDMGSAIRTIAAAKPDAIQLPPGTAPLLQAIPGKDKPALVLRTDIANVYGTPLPRALFSEVIDRAVEQGMVLDAACVVVNLLMLPDQPEVYRACVRNVNSLKRECEIMGMPLMVEPLVMQDNAKGGYMVDGNIDLILPLVRQAAELGLENFSVLCCHVLTPPAIAAIPIRRA